jgi:hypothetical protein
MLRVQGPKNNIPFEGKNDYFDPVSSSKERYGVQLNAEIVLM